MTESTFESAFGSYILERLPRRKKELLRAWDAADEYLLQHLADLEFSISRPLIINDSFGALSVALSPFNPVNWNDSWLAHQAAKENLMANDCADSAHGG